jgi:hypothetical protein
MQLDSEVALSSFKVVLLGTKIAPSGSKVALHGSKNPSTCTKVALEQGTSRARVEGLAGSIPLFRRWIAHCGRKGPVKNKGKGKD